MNMTYFSYHTHSSFCDGKENPEDYVKEGIKKGMRAIGFSSHAPLSVAVVWAMKASNLNAYIREINQLKEQYKDELDVYLSLELDYIPGISKDFSEWSRMAGLDYTIGSVHLVKAEKEDDFWFIDGPDTNYSEGLERLFQGDIQKAVSAYYHQVIEMIETQKPDVIGHIDKIKMNNKGRFFSEEEAWYVELLHKTLDAVEKSGSIVEVNTRGVYKKKSQKLFPGDYFLMECCKRGIPITISTDAHQPKELLEHFEECRKSLKQIGFEQITVFHKGEWIKESI
ncbi:histidinol-phosphatase [Marinifilum caeruleilacunae]|uniref:Histidinol-phosphatase n=1 Tax=Marinifilum caeruleilacunae TaxID=2499076 RepID=A0ABX1WTF5_9BACT|nr:histidinol-phosphatase [Marinifilum caeruleilacunae]NOU59209.1 histidinol-phosphatase HisJ family protein [Marinifilum caeruleilacunae]